MLIADRARGVEDHCEVFVAVGGAGDIPQHGGGEEDVDDVALLRLAREVVARPDQERRPRGDAALPVDVPPVVAPGHRDDAEVLELA
ncbi:hypothetical protein ACRAWC_22150 [Leifsonia sp. L25]|uniref:hypothetical protein n=1 Tax=Leifsonia sp. L25 TaxID=3423957 RepID=UPI003D68CC2E